MQKVPCAAAVLNCDSRGNCQKAKCNRKKNSTTVFCRFHSEIDAYQKWEPKENIPEGIDNIRTAASAHETAIRKIIEQSDLILEQLSSQIASLVALKSVLGDKLSQAKERLEVARTAWLQAKNDFNNLPNNDKLKDLLEIAKDGMFDVNKELSGLVELVQQTEQEEKACRLEARVVKQSADRLMEFLENPRAKRGFGAEGEMEILDVAGGGRIESGSKRAKEVREFR